MRAIESQSEFNRVHFFLLGNRFETLFLPAAIIVVEGKCDRQFIERALTVKYPNNQFSVIEAGSDDRIKDVVASARNLLTNINRSPYHDRIFAVTDSVHSRDLPAQLETMGLPKGNITVWPKNGIEYFYPPAIVDEIYGQGDALTIEGDLVGRNGTTHKKADLAALVTARMTGETVMHPELEAFLCRVGSAIGAAAGAT